MVLLKDIEPLLLGARIFGCAPHRATDKDLLVTRWGLVYSLTIALIFLYGCVAGVYLISVDIMEEKILLLTAGRTILSYICFFTDALLTTIWNEKLQHSMDQLHDFDVNTKFNQRVNLTLLCRWRIAIVTVVIFWSIVGYVTYRCEKSSPLFNGICYGIVNAAMSMQILKFIGYLTLLHQRFGHLERLILPEGVNGEKLWDCVGRGCRRSERSRNSLADSFPVSLVNITMRPHIDVSTYALGDARFGVLNQYGQRIQQHDVWWLHSRLINSAEQINSVYTVQLLFWITTMFVNALSRMYTLTGSDGSLSFLKVRESMSVVACMSNLLVITVVCHSTAVQSNRIGSTMFSPRSVLMRKRCYAEENIEVGMYFQLRKLHFSAGAGFIRIDLPLLLSIGGAMTTYLVILHALNN